MISQYGKHDRTRLLVNIQACKQKYLLGRGLRVGNQPAAELECREVLLTRFPNMLSWKPSELAPSSMGV